MNRPGQTSNRVSPQGRDVWAAILNPPECEEKSVSQESFEKARIAMAVLALSILATRGVARAQDPVTNDRQLDYIAARLALTEEQKEQVGRILSVDRQLADIHRANYRDDPALLQEATAKRVADTRKEIEALLTTGQKQVFADLQWPQSRGHLASDLAARLQLDPSQSAQVEKIMAESRLEELRTRMQSAGSDQEERRALGSEVRAEMERVDKEIEKILTLEQKQEYKKLKEERRQSMQRGRPPGPGGPGHGGPGGGEPGGGWQ
jgi:Spy/CpxP family protein refolding chaperone